MRYAVRWTAFSAWFVVHCIWRGAKERRGDWFRVAWYWLWL